MISKDHVWKAINEQCRQCVYDPQAPATWVEQVEGCRGYSCPLYGLRPRPHHTGHRVTLDKDPRWLERGGKWVKECSG